MSQEPFVGWAILELMGHRRLAGYVTEIEMAGAGMFRIDVPHSNRVGHDQDLASIDGTTQFYSPAALYCLTPTTEQIARGYAVENRPRPVQPFELTTPERIEGALRIDATSHERCTNCGHFERQHEPGGGPCTVMAGDPGDLPCDCVALEVNPPF